MRWFGAAVVAVLLPALALLAAGREEIRMLYELQPHGAGPWVERHQVPFGGVLVPRAWVPDLGWYKMMIALPGRWDLFEAWVGVPETVHRAGTITIEGDGRRLLHFAVEGGQPLRFISVPLEGVSTLTICSQNIALPYVYWVNPRLVRGRSKPSRPMDLIVRDGELVYIERPGEYRIRYAR